MKPKIISSIRLLGSGHEIQKNNIKTLSKKALLLILAVSFLTSCGPKRMSCYGKRCVENSSNTEAVKQINV